jgi:hypothetical protein
MILPEDGWAKFLTDILGGWLVLASGVLSAILWILKWVSKKIRKDSS